MIMKIQNLLINYTRQIIQQAESHTALGTAFSTIHAETCALYLCCKVTFASISPLNDNESLQQQATADLGLATSTVWAGARGRQACADHYRGAQVRLCSGLRQGCKY